MAITLRQVHERHARFYLNFAQSHRDDVKAISVELPNIEQALATSLNDSNWGVAIGLVEALSDFWLQRGPWEDYLKYGRVLISDGVSLDAPTKSSLAGKLATLSESMGRYHDAMALYKDQLRGLEAQEVRRIDSRCQVLRRLSRLAQDHGEYTEAEGYLRSAKALLQDQSRTKDEVDVLLDLAELRGARQDFESAELLARESLDKAQSIQYVRGMIAALKVCGSTQWVLNRFTDAKTSFQRAVAISTASGDHRSTAELTGMLSRLEATLNRDIFICYNNRDKAFAERLANDLKGAGLAVWWDQWEIKVGDSIVQKVGQAIDRSSYLAIVLSPDSVSSSWVKVELGSALMRHLSNERSIHILPLLVEDCEVPPLIRDLKWADFRGDYTAGIRSIIDTVIPAVPNGQDD